MDCRLFDLAGTQRTGRDSRDSGMKILSVEVGLFFFILLVIGFELGQGLARKDSQVQQHATLVIWKLRKAMSLV